MNRHPRDRFEQMVRTLRGQHVPQPPDAPGRVHSVKVMADDELAPWVGDAPTTAAELARALGITPQSAHERLQRAKRTGDTSMLLRPPRCATRDAARASVTHNNRQAKEPAA